MEHVTYKDKELDDRIHSFLNRKFAELATLERIPRGDTSAAKVRPTGGRMATIAHWGRV
jgi:hypothetical protein